MLQRQTSMTQRSAETDIYMGYVMPRAPREPCGKKHEVKHLSVNHPANIRRGLDFGQRQQAHSVIHLALYCTLGLIGLLNIFLMYRGGK